MFGGRIAKAIRPQRISQERNCVRSDDKRAFDGQQGISLAIPSVTTDDDISSAIACIGPPEDVCAMTGRETGASARPAITRIASSRRMAKVRFTELDFHSLAAMESLSFLHTMGSNRRY